MSTVEISDKAIDHRALIQQVAEGTMSEIVVTMEGRPVARIAALAGGDRKPRRLGLHAGAHSPMSREDFDAANAEIARRFFCSE